jgi:hypothetical protein
MSVMGKQPQLTTRNINDQSDIENMYHDISTTNFVAWIVPNFVPCPQVLSPVPSFVPCPLVLSPWAYIFVALLNCLQICPPFISEKGTNR